VNKDVDHICLEIDIDFQHTVPYIPQQNGAAKRKNRTLKEMENYMLHERALPPKLWVEAINYEE
jgi:hypothetical protein